jgi:hypothetical protein
MSTHETRLKQVREAFDVSALSAICMADESYFEKYGKVFVRDNKKENFAFYCQDDVSDVLGVAHLDSVQKKKDFGVAHYISGRELVMSPTLDDRLGVYVICELLPKLGIKTDILLTTDEEQGNSTARLFSTDKKYKWMFQFDRTGDDVVMYQYDTPALRAKLVEAGFKCGNGSASDISKLGDLGCSGMNFGVGYEDYHYERAWADLNVMFSQVAHFMKFYKTHKSEHLVYDKTVHKTTTVIGSSWTSGPSGGGSYGSNSWGPQRDEETDHGRRINNIWYSKTHWSESLQCYVPNSHLYKNYPSTRLPSWDKLCDANERWNGQERKWVLCDGKMTEDELLAAINGVLHSIGHVAIEKGPRQHSQTIVEDDLPKSLPGASLSGSSFDESTYAGGTDDPCTCGHSYFVHRRVMWRKGGHITSNDACDWWKCSCSHFEEITQTGSDILLGGD